jgi:hypothetical protein
MGFTPARPRVEVKDIVGTFWVDRASGELRWLEYRYTNVTAAAEHAGVGGRVEFLRLKSGEWFVSRWNILTATLGTAPTANANDASRNMLLASSEPPLKTLQVSGGEVSTLSRGDSLLYRTAGLALTLQVVSHDSIVPVAGASISLTGTDYSARADASGTARIAPVLTGQYHVSVHSALMDSLGAAPVERDVEVRDGVARIDSIALPAAADLLRASCRGEALGKNESMLRGTVRDSLGHGVRNAAVTVAPLSDPAKGGDGEGAIGVLTDGLGHWRLCGIRRGVSLAVRVETDDGGDARTLRLDESLPFAMADLVVRRPKASTDNAPAEPAGGSAKSKSALVEISVSMRNGVPLADAVVQLVPRSGPARTVKTSETGHALVAAVDAGVILVRTRGSSFKAGELSALVAPGRNTVPLVVGATTLPTLGGARMIGGTRVLARQEGFEARRWNHEASASITAGEIEQRHPAQTWQLLQSVASIDIREAQQNGTVTVLAASRQQRSQTTQSSELCYVKVMVDGVVLQADDPTTGQLNLVNLPPPATIHGLEVFAAGTSGPPEFRGADASRSCGLIAIWLK